MRERAGRISAVGVPDSSAGAADSIALVGMGDLERWRLRLEVALTVVPLISRVVADRDDRQAVVVDVVERWLALPAKIRQRYYPDAESENGGLERFGWEFVDTIEEGILSESDAAWPEPADARVVTTEAAEQVVFERWGHYLDSRRMAGQRETRLAA